MASFINRAPIDDTGKLLVTTTAPTSDWPVLGGFAYDPATGALAVVDSAPSAGDPTVGGIRMTNGGQVYVGTTLPSPIFYVGGLPVSADGRLFVGSGAAAGWVGGWPIDATGAVPVAGLGPPPEVVGPILPLVPTIGELLDTGALLTAVVTSNGAVTTVIFEYGTTTAYGTSIAAAQSPLAGDVIAELVSALVGGLTADTTYHWRVSATNSAGTTVSSDQSFTTLPAGTMFFDPLLNSLVPVTAGDPTPTFARATTAYVMAVKPTGNPNDAQLLIQVASGEARFHGARRIAANNWAKTYANSKVIPPESLFGYVAENAATNVCLRSQEFDDATWTKENTTVIANTQVAPDGTTTADTFTDDATNAKHRFYQSVPASGGTVFSYSVYVKAGTLTWMQLNFTNAATDRWANFNIATGTVGNKGASTTGSSIQALPNGWYRCSATTFADGSTVFAQILGSLTDVSSAGPTYVGTGQTMYLWGAQAEEADGLTSYLPTTTVAVTRAQDVLTYVWVSNIDGTVATTYTECYLPVAGAGQQVALNQQASRYPQTYTGAGLLRLFSGGGTATTVNARILGAVNKGATAWSGATGSVCLNGSTVATGPFSAFSNAGVLGIGSSGAGVLAIKGSVRNVRVYNARLTDAKLIPLTAIAPTVTTVAASGDIVATDPFFANVVALLHFEGTNGSTTFTDVKGGTWTGTGGVALSNASVPFGTTSCFFDGVDDLITSGSYAGVQFGTGDFTIECFMASTHGSNNYQTLIQSHAGQIEALLAYGSGGLQRGAYYRNGLFQGGSGTQALGVWKHVAYSRAAGVGHVFYDGIEGGAVGADTVNYSTAGITRLGSPTSALQIFRGYMKEMRITKGIARYTANFTPPTAAFPNS